MKKIQIKSIRNKESDMLEVVLNIEDDSIKLDEYILAVVARGSNTIILLDEDLSIVKEGCLKIDLRTLTKKLQEYKNQTFDIVLYSKINKGIYNLVYNQLDKLDEKSRFIDCLFKIDDFTYGAFYMTLKKELAILITNNSERILKKYQKSSHKIYSFDDKIEHVVRKDFSISNITIDDNKMYIKFDEGILYENIKNIKIYMLQRHTENKYVFNVSCDKESETIVLNFNKFFKSGIEKSRWDFFITYNENNILFCGRIGMFNKTFNNKLSRYFINSMEVEEQVITPYISDKNTLAMAVSTYGAYVNEKFKNNIKITGIKSRFGKLSIQGELKFKEIFKYEICGAQLSLRNKTKDALFYEIEAKSENIGNNAKSYIFTIDTNKYKFEQFYWDVFLLVKVEDEVIKVRVKNPTSKVASKISGSSIRYKYNLEDNYIVYPYITIHNALSFAFRQKVEYESLLYKLKEKIAAIIYLLFSNYFEQKDIWLVYEKFSETAQDNGYYFFKYCYENYPERNVFYIINKNSKDYDNIREYKDKVVHFMSIKHLIYLCACKILVASESRGHSYIQRSQTGFIRNKLYKKKLVFLQHGVIALKRIDGIFKKNSANGCDLFVTSSNYEKSLIRDIFQYDEKEILVTGLARWDALEDKSKQLDDKEIFFMPTWRNWLDDVTQEEFEKSSYFKNYMDILNSNKLDKLLKQDNITIKYFVHPKFKYYIDKFSTKSDRIQIVQHGEMQVNELLMRASLLITDYSSVAWEAYYQNKPTLFYHFDVKDYNKYQGSYLDLDNELFGDRAFTPDELISQIKKYIDTDFAQPSEYSEMRSKYFAYVDKNNSKRTYDAIIENKKMLYKNPKTTTLRLRIVKKLRKNKKFKKVWKKIKNNKIVGKPVVKLKNRLLKK